MKNCSAQWALSLVALGAVTVLLQGCDVGTETENCNGDACSCLLTFHSFWARIHISGVPIEHSSRIFNIPDAAKDVPNATLAPCCDAIFDQIDYDEGKSPTDPSKTVDSFSKQCASSPNKDVASAATRQSSSDAQSTAVARRLHGLRKAAAPQQQATQPNKLTAESQPILTWQDFYSPDGQDCDVTSSGFMLNNVNIAKGSMELRIRWVDPVDGSTPCCNALKDVLKDVYFKGVKESNLTADVKSNFCGSCKQSPNQGIALAAYRCFGAKPVEVAV